MIRILFFAALVLTIVMAVRALKRPRVGGSVRPALEPDYVRSEDFVEILALEGADELAAARKELDSKSIPTMVVGTTLMVPRSRLDEARAELAKKRNPSAIG